MTKEEILQKVNDYCNEKSYTDATLTDGFKDKFAEHFQKANPDADVNDEAILTSMKFALNSAFSSASSIIMDKTKAFEAKENEYKKQIEELTKKVADKKVVEKVEIPQELKDQLAELEKFKDAQSKQERLKEIMAIAKKGIRQDLHGSFERFTQDYEVKLDVENKEQANTLVAKFQDIFKDSIGDIKPLAPQIKTKRDEEILATIKKVKVC